jgi:hypothetical protein
MKVNNSDLTGVGATGADRTQESQKPSSGGANASKASSGTDSVDFSSTLGSLSRAMVALGASFSEKVSALATQYQSGAYSPDSAATSRGLISDALSE